MRVDRAQRILTRDEINGMVLFDPYNIRYLTGYKPAEMLGSSAAVLVQDAEPCLIVPQGESDLAQKESWIRDIQTYHSLISEKVQSPLLNHVQDVFGRFNLRSGDIGVELQHVSARRFEELKRLLPDAGFKNISGSLAELRMIKNESEIEKIQTAVQITENGLRAAMEFIKPGISEIEVAAEVERIIRKAGATLTGYPTVIASGPRAGCPYAPASRREIGVDEFVVISVSAINDDYCSNISRTVMTGKPSKKHNSIFKCARDSINTARNQLNPGTLARDIALNIRRSVDDRGFLQLLDTQMGNGIGLQPLESPVISPTDETQILPGMVFTIETGLGIAEKGGVRLSDTIAYLNDGEFVTLNQIPLDTA